MTQLATKDLAACEAVIGRGLSNFVEVGNALMRIRDGKLYRETHKTFEDYCRERWGMSKTHSNRMIDSAEVISNLTPIGVIPKSEAVTRPLAKLQPDEQKEAWAEAVKTAPDGKVTAKHVETVVENRASKFSPEAIAAGAEAEKDSAKLWALKSAWNRATKADREKFLKWIK